MELCEFIQVDLKLPDVTVWLTFIEFLVYNELRSSINNYISAIKFMFRWFNLNVLVFEHHKVNAMLRAVEVSVHKTSIQKGIFDIQQQQFFSLSSVFRTIYLFAFSGFSRISNMAPSLKFLFNIKTHLCRVDVIVHQEFLIILVKWSKTLQCSSKGTYVIFYNGRLRSERGHIFCTVQKSRI